MVQLPSMQEGMGRMKAADLHDEEVIAAVKALQPGYLGALRSDLEEHFMAYPPKVVLAKLRRLVKRGLLDGCGCGCRGDFTVKEQGA